MSTMYSSSNSGSNTHTCLHWGSDIGLARRLAVIHTHVYTGAVAVIYTHVYTGAVAVIHTHVYTGAVAVIYTHVYTGAVAVIHTHTCLQWGSDIGLARRLAAVHTHVYTGVVISGLHADWQQYTYVSTQASRGHSRCVVLMRVYGMKYTL